MITILAVLITNAITIAVMYRIMTNLPGVLEAKAYEERIENLHWKDVKWLQETGSKATVTGDPRSSLYRYKATHVAGRKPNFGIKVSGEAKLEVN